MNLLLTLLLLLIFCIVVIYISDRTEKKNKEKDPNWKENLLAEVKKIDRRAKVDNIDLLKNVLIDADKVLDHVLKSSGIKGNSLGDRLRNAKHLFRPADYDLIWAAHKNRNKLVHEIGYRISTQKLKDSIKILQKASKKVIKIK